MMYNGCNCGVCGKPLQEGDDIVVCPDCGTPYHRACYQEHGSCVHKAQHGHYEFKRPKAAADSLRCPNCGAANEKQNLFCENCGTPLSEAGRPQASAGNSVHAEELFSRMPPEAQELIGGAAALDKDIDGISGRDWAEYIGNSAPYYLFQFDRMNESGRKTSICWSALLFAPLYFFYRKVWSWAAVSTVGFALAAAPTVLQLLIKMNVPIGFTISDNTLNMLMLLAVVLNWALSVGFGIFAFYLFRKDASRKLQAMKNAAATEREYRETLSRRAGPSRIAVAVALLVMFLASMAFSSWIGPDKVMSYLYF